MERKSFYNWCIENNRIDILEEWNNEKNITSPKDVSLNSAKEVWWKCKEGHEWLQKLNHRFGHVNTTGHIRGCPICSNKQVLAGYNDLATKYPKIAEDWNYEKNTPLLPTQVSPGSTKKVWWKCKKGHEYQATINSKTNGNYHCPKCSKISKTSFPELAILFYLSKYFKNTKHRYSIEGIECDIYIEDLKIAIEYDGETWHNDFKDEQKFKNLSNIGIKLINIREPKCLRISNNNAYYLKNLKYDELENAINYIFNFIDKNIKPNIDLINDRNDIYSFSLNFEEENSLEKNYPELMKEWDYEKNKDLNPKYITNRSGLKVWWLCPQGHSYKAEIRSRTANNTKCPICANRQVLKGFNDLATNYPQIAEEWNYEKNFPILPTQVTSGSYKKVWWKCKYCGNELENIINNQVQNPLCPNCKNGQVQLLNTSSLNEQNIDDTSILSGNSKINLLKNECQSILSFVKQGMFILNSIEVPDESLLSISLYALLSGVKKLLKLIYMFQYVSDNGDFPTEESINKNVGGYDIKKILNNILDNYNTDSGLKNLKNNTIYASIIDSLAYFSEIQKKDFNLNQQNNSPLCSYWHSKVEKPICEQYHINNNTVAEQQKLINKYVIANIQCMIDILKNTLLDSTEYWKFIFKDIFQENS